MRYAQDTAVSVEKSKAEIERLLIRYGATSFLSGQQGERAMVAFEMKGKRIRFVLPLPDSNADEFKFTPAGCRMRGDEDRLKAWEQACRQRWRALTLTIKAKLEAVETGITTFEDEFMAHIVMPSGDTVGEWLKPQIEKAYESKKMPPMLPDLR